MFRILILLVLVINVSSASASDNELMASFQTDCAKYLNTAECGNFVKELTKYCRNGSKCIKEYITAFRLDEELSDVALDFIKHFCKVVNFKNMECFVIIKYKSEVCQIMYPNENMESCLLESIWSSYVEYELKTKKARLSAKDIEAIQQKCRASGIIDDDCFEATEMIKLVCKEDSKCVDDLWAKHYPRQSDQVT